MGSISIIANTNYQSKVLSFGIKESDRLGHIYAIGKTGMGKSTLLLNLAIQDIMSGKGFAVLDPHGDLCESIL
jgi:DNA helicase HerA-like ATPase